MALADTLRAIIGSDLPLTHPDSLARLASWRILDINGIPGLSDRLAGLPHYHRHDYPAIDLQALAFPENCFDLVIHSDTLEHVPDPMIALAECRRVLVPGGRLCFTVPLVAGRLSRDRAGLSPSYHGPRGTAWPDFLVRTEFGADTWTLPLRAGFERVEITGSRAPIAYAFSATKAAALALRIPLASQPTRWRDAVGRVKRRAKRWYRRMRAPSTAIYDQDGLLSLHNHDFMADPVFLTAYRRGVQAAGTDYNWHWRVHVGLWAARTAMALDGDFVECGVNRGFLSSALMQALDWDRTGRTFYLLDSFAGLDPAQLSDGEIVKPAHGFYTTELDSVRANFAEWRNIRLIPGWIPETLAMVDAEQIAFLHIDLNCAQPEIAALGAFWDRLVPGAIVLLDDYAYYGFDAQKRAMDGFALDHGVAILSLPTGQGLLVKPG